MPNETWGVHSTKSTWRTLSAFKDALIYLKICSFFLLRSHNSAFLSRCFQLCTISVQKSHFEAPSLQRNAASFFRNTFKLSSHARIIPPTLTPFKTVINQTTVCWKHTSCAYACMHATKTHKIQLNETFGWSLGSFFLLRNANSVQFVRAKAGIFKFSCTLSSFLLLSKATECFRHTSVHK